VYIQAIKDMYERGKASLRTLGGVINDFYVSLGLLQASTLSLFFFTLVMDELTKGIQDELPWRILFADYIFLIDETREGVNDKLERWRHTWESRDFRVSRSKIECLHCCFSGKEEEGGEVTINGMIIPKVENFKYPGSIIQQKENIDDDINHHIKVG